MKKFVAISMVTIMSLCTLVGCGKKAEEPVTLQEQTDDAFAEVTPKTEVNTSVDDGRVDMSSVSEKPAPLEEKKEYTKEMVAQALDLKQGVEMSYDQDGSSFVIGLKEGAENFMYMIVEKKFDGGQVNRSGYYVYNDDVYTFIGDADTNYFEHHITNMSEDEKGDMDTSSSVGKFTVSDTDVDHIEVKDQQEVDGKTYDVVAVFSKEDVEMAQDLENEIAEMEANDEDGGTVSYSINGETTVMTGLESKKASLERYKNPMCYYFDLETGEVAYVSTYDDMGNAQLATVRQDIKFEKPAWFDTAEEIDGSNGEAIFGELMMVMFMPMMEEPLTKEALEEEMSAAGNMSFDFSMQSDGNDVDVEMDSDGVSVKTE